MTSQLRMATASPRRERLSSVEHSDGFDVVRPREEHMAFSVHHLPAACSQSSCVTLQCFEPAADVNESASSSSRVSLLLIAASEARKDCTVKALQTCSSDMACGSKLHLSTPPSAPLPPSPSIKNTAGHTSTRTFLGGSTMIQVASSAEPSARASVADATCANRQRGRPN